MDTLRLLDILEIPAIIIGERGSVVGISAAGASLLGIRNRLEISEWERFVEPLLHVAKDSGSFQELPARSIPVELGDGRELLLCTYARSLPECKVIIFHALSVIDALLADRNRQDIALPLSVAGISCLTRQTDFCDDLDAFIRTPMQEKGSCDLLHTLSQAISCSDHYLPRTVKINTEVKTSVLVGLGEQNLFRLFLQLLIEAGLFAAPAGQVKLRTVLDSAHMSVRPAQEQVIELVLFSERGLSTDHALPPFEQFLSRQLHQRLYSVTVADDEPTIRQLSNGEAVLRRLSRRGELKDNGSLSRENMSVNLRAAHDFAEAIGVELQVRRPRSDTFSAFIQLPLAEVVSWGER